MFRALSVVAHTSYVESHVYSCPRITNPLLTRFRLRQTCSCCWPDRRCRLWWLFYLLHTNPEPNRLVDMSLVLPRPSAPLASSVHRRPLLGWLRSRYLHRLSRKPKSNLPIAFLRGGSTAFLLRQRRQRALISLETCKVRAIASYMAGLTAQVASSLAGSRTSVASRLSCVAAVSPPSSPTLAPPPRARSPAASAWPPEARFLGRVA